MNLPFQIIIVDDEAHARGFVRNMLLQHCPGTVVAGEADGVAAAVGLLRETKADLLLLDVEMEDGTGFDLLDQIPVLCFHVVFTTAHNDFALRAFRYNAIDYLLKPVDPNHLVSAVRKAQESNHVAGCRTDPRHQRQNPGQDHDPHQQRACFCSVAGHRAHRKLRQLQFRVPLLWRAPPGCPKPQGIRGNAPASRLFQGPPVIYREHGFYPQTSERR